MTDSNGKPRKRSVPLDVMEPAAAAAAAAETVVAPRKPPAIEPAVKSAPSPVAGS